ncbi:cytochrome C oxidase subunit II [Bordetella flabilis]|uniref:Cytochrome C oxidase subunit II n=2 Tax=Bordetella flabilis TaxID=463014 RepID=A0A193GCW6_9BORD|nr:cytochrome C oxidase subunit II [Bordetella flabilis]
MPLPANARPQSVLDPAGPYAQRVTEMGWVLFIGGGVLFVWVLATLALALYGPPGLRARLGQRRIIVVAGIGVPSIILSALLVYAFGTAAFMARAGSPPGARIEVKGEMWWWRVRYLDANGQALFETANDIRIPTGQPVDFTLASDNVIHSFWVPNLGGKVDMIPGRVNRLRLQADAPGRFSGQCAEYCGAQHARMRFDVMAVDPAEFEAWLQAQRRPAPEPADTRLWAGQQLFMRACAQCHTVRGTAAAGRLGPDLTHIGSRLSLAAGTLPNNVGTLAGWIAGSQHIKPGNQMPSFNQLSGEGLRAVAQYMESLK